MFIFAPQSLVSAAGLPGNRRYDCFKRLEVDG
jgi:hypothetical protein